MGQFTRECQRIATFLPATMAVKSTKLSGACSLEKEGEILSKLDGCPGVKQCYGETLPWVKKRRRFIICCWICLWCYLSWSYWQKRRLWVTWTSEVRFYTRCVLEGLQKFMSSVLFNVIQNLTTCWWLLLALLLLLTMWQKLVQRKQIKRLL